MSRSATPLALALALCAITTLGAQAAETVTLRGTDVAIYNLAGVVRVERGTGRDVTVEVRRGGTDGAKLKLETGELRGHQTLRVMYDADRVVYPKLGRWSNTTMNVARLRVSRSVHCRLTPRPRACVECSQSASIDPRAPRRPRAVSRRRSTV